MCDLVHGTIGVDANKAGDASHPFPLVCRIAPRAEDKSLQRLLARKLSHVAEAERLDCGGRDRSGERGLCFSDDAGGEHRASTLLDSVHQNVAGNVESEDRSRPAQLGSPEPVSSRPQRGPELGELEGPDYATPVVAMKPGSGTGIALDQDGVRTLGPETVVELLPLSPLLRSRCRGELELRHCCTEIQTG